MTDAGVHNVVIIGTGPAGLTAAIYAARGGQKPIIFAGPQQGGQLTTTTEVENFPGFEHGIMGPKLMEDMTKQAQRFGSELIYDAITKVDFKNRPFTLWAGDTSYKAKSVIIATGATAKTLGLAHEAELMGRGVSTCATCDGFFYKNKVVAVVGGGDSAMEESSYLAKLCSKVYLIHRRAEFKASKIMLDRARKNPVIEFLVPHDVDSILYDKSGVTGIKIRNLETKQMRDLKVDGFFMAIGHSPNSKPFLPFVEVDQNGYILTHDFVKTKIPGVFAAGDIADHVFRQAITAAGMGCQAAILALRYLEEIEH